MKQWIFLSGVLTLGLFSACNNDLDINGEFTNQAAVYALLDPTQDTQWVRVHRVYLGQGDATVSAQEADSIYYDSVDVFLDELVNGTTVNSIELERDETSRALQPGFFTTEGYHIYRTTENLNISASYKLRVVRPDGSEITAITPMVQDFSIIKPTVVEKLTFNPARNLEIKWNSGVNGRVYQPYLRFVYMEQKLDNKADSVHKSLIYPLNVRRAGGLDGDDELFTNMTYSGFMSFVANNIEQDPNVLRWVRYADVYIYGGSDDLNTFMNVNGPTTGINLDRPQFTNINGGTGIFASRNTISRTGKEFSNLNKDSLVVSQYTCGLNFSKVVLNAGVPDTCYCINGVLECF